MKYIPIAILFSVSFSGRTQEINYLEFNKSQSAEMAKEMELDTVGYPKIRMWHDFITIELILEEGNCWGNVNYFVFWSDNSGNDGFEFKKDTLTHDQFEELHRILIDSMNVIERIPYEDIRLFDYCYGGQLQYFPNKNSYLNRDCSAEYNSNSSFIKFIERNFPIEHKVKNLLDNINADGAISYSSYFNCCGCNLIYDK